MVRKSSCAATCFFTSYCILFCIGVVRTAALADGTSVSIGVGTLGAALNISQSINSLTTLRLTYGTFQFSRQGNYDNVVIDVLTRLRLSEQFRAQTVGLYAERHIRSQFHVTFGAVVNQNHISAVSLPADSSVVINGYTYSAAQAGEIFTNVKWMPVSPYVGVGFGPRATDRRRLALVGEIGAYYQGSAKVTFDANGEIKANQANFSKYYDALKVQLAQELSPVEVFPVIQLGLRLRM